MASWFQREVIDAGKLPLFLCFTAFVVTFLATRTITRLIRAGRGPFKDNVSSGGLHIHHAVPGTILLVVGAFMAVAVGSASPWAEIAGVLVGVGTSLLLDEFALIVHLEDVYWAKEGQLSVQLIGLAVACLGLVLLGISPFADDLDAGLGVGGIVVTLLIHGTSVALCVVKGKLRLALFSIFVPLIGWVGAIRLARPRSRWAKRRYSPQRLAKAEARAARSDARWRPIGLWMETRIAGMPAAVEATEGPADRSAPAEASPGGSGTVPRWPA